MRKIGMRVLAATLALAVCVSAAGCDDSVQDGGVQVDCAQLALAIWNDQADVPAEHVEISAGDATWADWLESVYDVEPATVQDGADVYAQGGTYSDEVAVLRASDRDAAKDIEEKLSEYLQRRLSTFAGYAPDEEYQLGRSKVVRSGDYVALLAVPDASAAQAVLEDGMGGRIESAQEPEAAESAPSATPEDLASEPAQVVQEEPPMPEEPAAGTLPSAEPEPAVDTAAASADAYDHDAVMAAWWSGDTSALTPQNLAVYQQASSILGSVTTPDMSQHDQELAVHNYLADHMSYDSNALGHAASEADPASSTPYGGLVLGTAICYGYSSSFQLLMDMLGIPCVTVNGTINSESRPHSWNMVSLDDSWYHVDVGWDDPIGGRPYLKYFNRASDDPIMSESNRQWDRTAYPEALGGPLEGPAEY